MADWVAVAKTTELGAGQAKTVEVQGQSIAVFNVEGAYYAIDDICTHQGASLSEGSVEDAAVTCPWHGAQFDLKTGKALSFPAVTGVKSYPVKIEGHDIQLQI